MMQLRGTLTSHPNGDAVDAEIQGHGDKHFWLVNEVDKKASFYLDFSSTGESGQVEEEEDPPRPSISMDKPCHFLLECHDSDNSTMRKEGAKEGVGRSSFCHPWLFGGVEIHSNSRNIEVYAVVDAEKGISAKEEYWQTCRGHQVQVEEHKDGIDAGTKIWKKDEIYKTIILPPTGKATTILRLHLKLLSLRPAKCTVGSIFLLKLKGRIHESSNDEKVSPEHYGVSNTPASTNNQSTFSQSQADANPSPQTAVNTNNSPDIANIEANIGHAFGGLTSLIHTVKNTMERGINTAAGQAQKAAIVQNKKLEGKMMQLEQSVLAVKDSVDNLIEEMKETKIKEKRERKDMERDLTIRIEKALRLQQQEQFERLEKSIVAAMEKSIQNTCAQVKTQLKEQIQSRDEVLNDEMFQKRSKEKGNETFQSSNMEDANVNGEQCLENQDEETLK